MGIKGRGLWGNSLYVGNPHLDELVKSQKNASPLTGEGQGEGEESGNPAKSSIPPPFIPPAGGGII